jgi:peptide/nickel transport system ATP-binding protein
VSAAGATDPLLAVAGLSIEFATDSGWVRVIDDVTLHVGRNETVAVVGESGSGKSVTSLAVMGLIPQPPGRIVAGSVRFDGMEMVGLSERQYQKVRGDRIAMIFQEPMSSLNPAFSVGEQIAEVVRWHRGWSRKKARERAVEMLGLVGIPQPSRRAGDYPHQFSGGMRQRVMIAMALSCDPQLLIADEPTTALDVTIQAQVLDLLERMRAEFEMSMLFITHDLGVVAEVADRVVVMYSGQVVEQGTAEPVFDHPRHPYTEGLLAAVPSTEGRRDALAIIPGSPPVPGTTPPGCHFHPRCAYRIDACCSGSIALRDLGAGRQSRCIRVDELELEGAT